MSRNEIRCPHCGKTFQVDEHDYAAILAQVRTSEFREEIRRHVADLESRHKAEEKAAAIAAGREADRRIAEKEREMLRLQGEIDRLNGVIGNYAASKKAEMAELEAAKEKRIMELQAMIDGAERRHELDLIKVRNAGAEELNVRQQEIIRLNSRLESEQAAARNREMELRERHRTQLLDKQEEIDRLRDFKTRLSTKMVGETLEEHCAVTFARAQCMGLFPGAEFGKDNDARGGSKGDFIFRDSIGDREYISVMFEMKNEMDTTATKHRNTDFLEKLDRDRREKKCEYAVLVSMLEQGNELYDGGIVDMGHRYGKMYVIRPQFFLPLLRILTEASRKNMADMLSLREELEAARSQSFDVARFEERLNRFKTTFDRNVTAAHTKYESAVAGIDKVIADLEKQISALRAVKGNFEASEMKLLKANEVAEESLTIRKLTYGNPTMKAKFEEARRLAGERGED